MPSKTLGSAATSVFCDSVSSLIASGMQTDEALMMLCDGMPASRFQEACSSTCAHVLSGHTLSDAMLRSGAFPSHAVTMVSAGESAGRLEQTLSSLATHYADEAALESQLRRDLRRPVATLSVITIVLGVTVFAIMPSFDRTYSSMARVLAIDSSGSTHVARAIGVVAFAVALALTVLAACLWLRSLGHGGVEGVSRLMEGVPVVSKVAYQTELAGFASVMATHMSAGATSEDAMLEASGNVRHKVLGARLRKAHAMMTDAENPVGLGDALESSKVLEPLHARILEAGARSGRGEDALMGLSEDLRSDAVFRAGSLIDGIDPVLNGMMALVVVVAIVAVMLPLIGILTTM